MKHELPEHYHDHERAPAKYCLQCGQPLTFDSEDSFRWRCTCGWVFHDHPQPVATALIATDPRDVEDRRVRKANNAINSSRSSVLVIQRKRPPFANQWALPGGFVNSYEHPERAAAREVMEELGIRVQLLRFLGACHPHHHSPKRFSMNNIVNSWLAQVDEDGFMEPQDDALDAAMCRKNEVAELCFSSHRYIVENWFAGKYPWSKGIHPVEARHENQNRGEDVHHCIRCSTSMVWDEKIERYRCADVAECSWVYWNSPEPYAQAVLSFGSQLLLQREDAYWTLPYTVVPAYHTPREALKNALAPETELTLFQNLAATKIDVGNRVDMLFSGALRPPSILPKTFRPFPVTRLPSDLSPAALEIIQKFRSGYYESVGSKR